MKHSRSVATAMILALMLAMSAQGMGNDDALQRAATALGDLERQTYRGMVSPPEAAALLRRFLSDIDTAMANVPKVTDVPPGEPLVSPKGEAPVKALRRGKGSGASLVDGKAAFKQIHMVYEIPDKNGDSLWDKTFKPMEILAPEAGVVVELTPQDFPDPDDRGRVVALYAPATEHLWIFYPLKWSALQPGVVVKAGDVLGHLMSEGKTARLRAHRFTVAMGDACVAPAPAEKKSKKALKK